ncbi:MAG TPA: undecaprenyldiphospho-muramoylpentapeptide beta-N-acetylglucosaminyltransferase [bacterium]|nr:undecaprenyldiphospho-muramoylpentapeptide beta-N-acetylglucosaminyltransferase [bacterium]
MALKVILSGGGTGGSVSPLIAIYQRMKKLQPEAEFLWLGQYEGVEKQMVAQYGIPYQGISSGKLRRYFSWQNFVDPFRLLKGWWQARKIIKEFKPDVILSAGSFVSVPVAYAAKNLGIKFLVHQQDISIGLANRLMLKKATWINLTLTDLKYTLPKTVEVLPYGNPIREEILHGSKEKFCTRFNFDASKPIVLITGGGTGALHLNQAIDQQAGNLAQSVQIVHLCGKGKNLRDFGAYYDNQYQVVEFFNAREMGDALAAADLVVTRAGLSALSEISVLGKATIIIPLINTHQEENARYWEDREAAVVLSENNLDALTETIENLLADKQQLEKLSLNIKNIMPGDAAEKIGEMFMGLE